jgi:hypothetical protein
MIDYLDFLEKELKKGSLSATGKIPEYYSHSISSDKNFSLVKYVYVEE